MTPTSEQGGDRPKFVLFRLWRGDLPLATAFWEYAVAYGSILNLLTTFVSFAVLAMKGSTALAVALHIMPLPYNVAVVVGVWRSAARYAGERRWAEIARVAVIVWALLASLL